MYLISFLTLWLLCIDETGEVERNVTSYCVEFPRFMRYFRHHTAVFYIMTRLLSTFLCTFTTLQLLPGNSLQRALLFGKYLLSYWWDIFICCNGSMCVSRNDFCVTLIGFVDEYREEVVSVRIRIIAVQLWRINFNAKLCSLECIELWENLKQPKRRQKW